MKIVMPSQAPSMDTRQHFKHLSTNNDPSPQFLPLLKPLSHGLSSFIEHNKVTYRELEIDLPSAHLTVETETNSRQWKMSTTSGMLIRVEPEG